MSRKQKIAIGDPKAYSDICLGGQKGGGGYKCSLGAYGGEDDGMQLRRAARAGGNVMRTIFRMSCEGGAWIRSTRPGAMFTCRGPGGQINGATCHSTAYKNAFVLDRLRRTRPDNAKTIHPVFFFWWRDLILKGPTSGRNP